MTGVNNILAFRNDLSAKDNTVDSLDKLYETYKTDVFRFVLLLIKDYPLAQDVTQEVFLKVLQNSANLKDAKKSSRGLCLLLKIQCITY